MFFRRGNLVKVDFIETNKSSIVGTTQEFSHEGVVITDEKENKTRFIPMTSISEVVLIKPVDTRPGAIKTQM